MEKQELLKDENGFSFYKEPPSNFVQAQPEDFYQQISVYDEEGTFMNFETVLKETHAFLVQSFHYDIYWAYRVKENFNPDNLTPWFADGRVLIYKNDL